MTAVEGHVTTKVGEALDMIKAVNERQQAQMARLQEIQISIDEQKEKGRAQDDTIREIPRRIDLLEAKQAAPPVWRPQNFEGEIDGPRAPALILGGWDDTTDDVISTESKGLRRGSQP